MKGETLRILMAGAECAPFAKVGGLADVMGTLPKTLLDLGMDARVIMPLHGCFKEKVKDKLTHLSSFYVHLGWRTQYVGVETMVEDGVTYYFIDNEFYFGSKIYKGGEAEGEQYAFFARAVLDCIPFLGFVPHVIHANDWHTAAIPLLIKTQYGGQIQGNIKTLFTIHNLGFQGKFHPDFLKDILGIEDKYFTTDYLEAYGCANLLKGALVFADALSTVSPTYAGEICTPAYGEGLDGLLQSRRQDLYGILNGIDRALYDPEKDPALPAHFSLKDLSGKTEVKKALMEEFGLEVKEDRPLVGMVTRLTSQKGLDLLARILHDFMAEDVALVILGSGDSRYENFFSQAAASYPGKMSVRIEYNDALARRIYAGSDFFLMPSLFEPCGIAQMIAMRYGTLPIVRETGGLKDTVVPYNQYTGAGDGFSFAGCDPYVLLKVLRMAIETYGKEEALLGLRSAAMTKELTFTASAREYGEIYQRIVEE